MAVALLVSVWILLSGWGGYVDPRQWTFPSVVVLTYPAAMLVALLTLVVALISRAWKAAILLAVSLLLTLPAMRVNMPLGGSREPSDTAATFSMLTYNVTGFGCMKGNEEVSSTMRYILDANADLVMLQEGSLGPRDFTDVPSVHPMKAEICSKYPYRSYGYHDLIILSRYPYTVYEDTTLCNGFGSPDDIHKEYHFFAKAFDIEMPKGRQLRIINLHLQSIGLSAEDKQIYRNITHLDSVQSREQMHQARHSLYAKLAGAFRRRAGEAHHLREIINNSPENLIVCGDFNDTPASYCYWTVRGSDMADAYAQRGRSLTYTFNKDLMLFKIDHVLYRGDMNAVSIRRDKAGASDHYPLLTTFEWQDDKKLK